MITLKFLNLIEQNQELGDKYNQLAVESNLFRNQEDFTIESLIDILKLFKELMYGYYTSYMLTHPAPSIYSRSPDEPAPEIYWGAIQKELGQNLDSLLQYLFSASKIDSLDRDKLAKLQTALDNLTSVIPVSAYGADIQRLRETIRLVLVIKGSAIRKILAPVIEVNTQNQVFTSFHECVISKSQEPQYDEPLKIIRSEIRGKVPANISDEELEVLVTTDVDLLSTIERALDIFLNLYFFEVYTSFSSEGDFNLESLQSFVVDSIFNEFNYLTSAEEDSIRRIQLNTFAFVIPILRKISNKKSMRGAKDSLESMISVLESRKLDLLNLE
jgi:hypothetical protein